jgi:glycosyltransferase involved in cell wall biosynthesis
VTILCFADTRFPIERANGVQTMATCHALAACGDRVTLVVRPDTSDPRRDAFEFYGLPRVPGLTIETVESPNNVRARRARFLLAGARRALRSRADVVYTRDLGLAALLIRIPSGRRPPIVYESHGLSTVVSAELPTLLGKPELEPSPGKLRRLDARERRVWRGADAYVTITRALAAELAARYGPRVRVFVVPDGAAATLEPDDSRESAPALAAYAGHLYPWKGVDIFLQALARTSGMRALIVGGHPVEADTLRVRRLIDELALTGRVKMTGLVKPAAVRARLAPATMLVLPNTQSAMSERYTSPLKLFEYLGMRRPIIASDLPAIREVLRDGETALLVPPGDPAALAIAMERVAGDPALARRLAARAAALAPEYTWGRRAERLHDALMSSAGA